MVALIHTPTELSLEAIRLDGGTQPRAELNTEHIHDLTEILLEGGTFKDPIIVYYDGSHYWLADGFHRVHAAMQAEVSTIAAEVRQGTQEDAIEHSCGVNAFHGLKRKHGDIERAIKRLRELPKWKDKTHQEIADHVHVSRRRVSQVLQESEGKISQSATKQPVEPDEEVQEVRFNRTTNQDKRRSVESFFAEFPQLQALSNREIAKRCGVDETLVRKIRKELFPELAVEPETTPEAPILFDATSQMLQGTQLAQTALEATIEDEPLAFVPMPETRDEPEIEPEPPKLPKIEPSEEVQRERELRRQQAQERNEQLREKGVDLPQGKYSCLVVDPPWTMQKIEREERPNQFEFDYPTMTEDELKSFSLPELAADNCHLYLWTTQKHLPMALRLAEHWGFKYQCLMTWVKNVGFTPFSWMYSTEHVLFCTKGSLPLLAIGKRLDFSAVVREHSRKPDEFYDIVREVSPGPRLDVFSREKREGFEQYGNEVEKYV